MTRRSIGRSILRRLAAAGAAALGAAMLLAGPPNLTIPSAGGPTSAVLSAVRQSTSGSVARATSAFDAGAPELARAADPALLRGYVWPLAHGRVTLPFGPTPWGDLVVNGQPFHDGMDLASFCGDRVVAAHAGTVLAAGRHYDSYIGWRGDLTAYDARLTAKHYWDSLPIVVVIDDENGYRSIYAHFNAVVVAPGQHVAAGQFIGYEGATGRASGCHVHYGLFSPVEAESFGLDPVVAAHMLLPSQETARVDPLAVLPYRADVKEMVRPWPVGPRPVEQAAIDD